MKKCTRKCFGTTELSITGSMCKSCPWYKECIKVKPRILREKRKKVLPTIKNPV